MSAKQSLINLSLPTKKQVIDIVEYALVGFVSTFVAVWAKQPDPFSKRAIIVAFGAATGAIVAVIKGFTTSL